MAKVVKTTIKLNLPAGEATPAPPVGPALGQHGIPIMDFIKQYNERTNDKKGQIIPVLITVFEDNSFEFETKLSPVTELIKSELKLEKASSNAGKNIVATLKKSQLLKIAEVKMKDLNAYNIEEASKIVAGTARSMGIAVELE